MATALTARLIHLASDNRYMDNGNNRDTSPDEHANEQNKILTKWVLIHHFDDDRKPDLLMCRY